MPNSQLNKQIFLFVMVVSGVWK